MNQTIRLAITMPLLECAALPLIGGQTRHTVSTDKHEWVMSHSGDGHEFHLRIKGKPESTEDYSAIRSLAPDRFRSRKDAFSDAKTGNHCGGG